jgi:hypothetical protein
MIDPFNAYYRWLIDILDKSTKARFRASQVFSQIAQCPIIAEEEKLLIFREGTE